MAATHILAKKIDLGRGFTYFEIVKPTKVNTHQLRQYIQHEGCEASLTVAFVVSDSGEEHPYFGCWVCGAICPEEVIEKGMTILSMRVL